MNTYTVEVTDTFGGEANYMWVQNHTVRAKTTRGAMRIIANLLPYAGGVRKDYDTGDMERWMWKKACVCAFIEQVEGRA